MISRPPSPTLFPYTTLFRSYADALSLMEQLTATAVRTIFADNIGQEITTTAIRDAFDDAFGAGAGARVKVSCKQRSEEHTSELQSLRHLVCRLVLEKKNANNAPIYGGPFYEMSVDASGDVLRVGMLDGGRVWNYDLPTARRLCGRGVGGYGDLSAMK